MADAINLSTEGLEVPKEFSEAVARIKEDVAASQKEEAPYEQVKRGRGRPKKVKDELDESVHDEVDQPMDTPPAVDTAKADDEEVDEEPAKSTVETDEYIPDEWVNAARKTGMSDETIRTLATESPDVLKNLAGKSVVPEVRPTPQAAPTPPPSRGVEDDLFKPVELKLDPDVHGDDLVRTVDALVKRINDQTTVMKQLNDQNKVTQADIHLRGIKAQEDRFDTLLDKVSSDLPAVGKSDAVKSGTPQFEVRKTIWDKAEALRRGDPSTKFEDSIDDVLAWYRGKHGTKFIEQQTVTKLKARAAKLTYRPKSKQATEQQYGTEEEAAVARIKQAKQKYMP